MATQSTSWHEKESRSVEASYRYCGGVARRAASNFYWSFWLLGREQRKAMCALYAFARYADDVADEPGTDVERRAALKELRTALETALLTSDIEPGTSNNLHRLLPAVCDTVRKFKVPIRYLLDILDGVAMDLDEPQFETFDDLRVYCYRVASAVGLACLHIWGFTSDEALTPAIDCGIAFQLTNILRDLKEDAARGRIYLPREDLRRFGYSEFDLQQHVRDRRLLDLLQFHIVRAEQYYESGVRTLPFLSPEGRRAFRMMYGTYRSLLRQVKDRRGDIFGPRIRLGRGSKLIVFLRAMLGLPTLARSASEGEAP